MKVILFWCGGKIVIVEYICDECVVGMIKFNGWKLWNLVLEGIIGFLIVFFRMWMYIGFVIFLLVFVYGLMMIVEKFIWGNDVLGYFFLMVLVFFLGGV